MNMKILLLVLLSLGIAFAGLSVTSWTLSQDSYKPGSNGVLTLDLSNPLVATDTRTVQSVDIDTTTSPEILMTGEQFVGDIEPGGSTKISLPFKVSGNATSSIYTAEIKVTGFADRPGTGGGYDTFSRRIVVPITVVNEPILSLKTDSQLIGGIDTVLLTVTNNGGKASNLQIRIPAASDLASLASSSSAGTSASPPSVGLYGEDRVYIASVASGKSASVNITLDSRDAADGSTDVPLLLEYDDELGITHTDLTSLRLTVRNEKLNLKFTQGSDVVTKQEGNLTLTIRNDGSAELKDVRLSFTNSTLRLKDSGELKFGDLSPNESAIASADVYADLPPGVNLISSKLSWIEKDVQKEESRSIPLTITSDADVGVFLEAKPLPLTLGAEHTISVLVSNLGSYKIDNVDVTIDSPAMSSLDISDRQYIGGLQTDDFSTVQFLMKVNATSAGSYPVRIAVNYRDQSGEWKSKDITQSVSVYGAQQTEMSLQSLLPCVGAIVVLAAVAAWFFFVRNRGKK